MTHRYNCCAVLSRALHPASIPADSLKRQSSSTWLDLDLTQTGWLSLHQDFISVRLTYSTTTT